MPKPLTDEQFARLLEFRVALRQFTHWSAEQAAAAGLTSAQHQLLVAIRGHEGERGPTLTDVADYLLVRHHSVIGLVRRAEALKLVKRKPDPDDQRLVRLELTALGRRRVDQLAALHLAELANLEPLLDALVKTATDGE
ncbi:MAG: winged helix-turn-helix transcriptional regulator [Actinobacteria bacterium]|nr:winged helix-turn-helix transcriptional regulator [Actinomycetota bacterium]MBV8957214.1 winged helix-turn-helix transcriptional regulator [Actinomycetota bacterium]MBV9252937.1 winged helix-turn-helix transcriptional regulator [Actinomycetota bacterium]MBV9932962.1 winged helix-turn-helix transcriptional regulator [Actinomycetota bacterium]